MYISSAWVNNSCGLSTQLTLHCLTVYVWFAPDIQSSWNLTNMLNFQLQLWHSSCVYIILKGFPTSGWTLTCSQMYEYLITFDKRCATWNDAFLTISSDFWLGRYGLSGRRGGVYYLSHLLPSDFIVSSRYILWRRLGHITVNSYCLY